MMDAQPDSRSLHEYHFKRSEREKGGVTNEGEKKEKRCEDKELKKYHEIN